MQVTRKGTRCLGATRIINNARLPHIRLVWQLSTQGKNHAAPLDVAECVIIELSVAPLALL